MEFKALEGMNPNNPMRINYKNGHERDRLMVRREAKVLPGVRKWIINHMEYWDALHEVFTNVTTDIRIKAKDMKARAPWLEKGLFVYSSMRLSNSLVIPLAYVNCDTMYRFKSDLDKDNTNADYKWSRRKDDGMRALLHSSNRYIPQLRDVFPHATIMMVEWGYVITSDIVLDVDEMNRLFMTNGGGSDT